jgi:hypothetical protein
MNLDTIQLLPMTGIPIAGQPVAVDAIHHQVIDTCLWPLASPVLNLAPGDSDLVLIAVPKGLGTVLAQWIANQTLAVDEDPA